MKPKITEDCPIARVATLLSDTWTMLVLRDLLKAPMRYCELEDSLSGISTRTLALKLKMLEVNGIIAKKSNYYAPTAKGKKLGAILSEMTKYGKKYLK